MTLIDELESLIAPSVACNPYSTPQFNKIILSPPEKVVLIDSALLEGNPYTNADGIATTGIADIGHKKNSNSKSQSICIQYTEKEKRERKYECEYCKKRFSRPSSLTSHVYTHTGERPFGCDFPECTKRFSVLSNLRRHYRVHSNRRQRNGKKRGRGRSPTVSGHYLRHGHFGPSYLDNDNGYRNGNSNIMEDSLNRLISDNRFVASNSTNPTMGHIDPNGSVYFPPFNNRNSIASSASLFMPLDSQALFTTKCSYAPSIRATAAAHTPEVSLSGMCNASTSMGCIPVVNADKTSGPLLPSAPQVSFTERPILYDDRPTSLSAQNNFGGGMSASISNSNDHTPLLSLLSAHTDNPANGGIDYSNGAKNRGCETGITTAQLEALINGTSSTSPGCTGDKIDSTSSTSSRSSTSSNDGWCNDLLSTKIWPFQADSAITGSTSKGMGSLETLTAAASAATNAFFPEEDGSKRQQFHSEPSNGCQKLSIALPAIATNTFVTTKAMNAGIDILPMSNSLDPSRPSYPFHTDTHHYHSHKRC